MNQSSLKNKNFEAIVLFTGGADSTLSAALSLSNYNNIVLLTFKNSWEFFVERSALMAERLRRRYNDRLIIHKIIENKELYNLILRNNKINYFRNIGLLCFAQRAAMYIKTAAFCLENQIKCIIDGSNRKQSNLALPQRQEALAVIRNFFQNYGLQYISPIYEYTELSEDLLLQLGLIEKKELYQTKTLFFKKDSFILFDIFIFLSQKYKNKSHPIFLIETMLQFLGRLTRFKFLSEADKQKRLKKALGYFQNTLKFGEEYLSSQEYNDFR